MQDNSIASYGSTPRRRPLDALLCKVPGWMTSYDRPGHVVCGPPRDVPAFLLACGRSASDPLGRP